MRDVQTVKIDCFHQFWVCAALTLATVAVFYQVCTYDFVNYDDSLYVYNNPNIQAGITLKAIEWAFTTGYASFWHPLTWLSHMLDWQLFGSNPAGHHLTNLIIHIANTLLLFIVLKRMTHSPWPSAFVAALFALHPLHVESVAWVSERKDVLSTFFWLLTMWAYVCFVSRPRISNYLLVVALFALGLMAKPMLVTLPFVLLLLDYWPLDRLRLTTIPKHRRANTKYSLPYLLIEKIPLFVMALASCIVALITQKKGGAIHTGENYTFLIRLANASISYLQYIIKMIWPTRLVFFYAHPGQNVSVLYAAISAALLLSVTILILRFAANRRYLVTGWFWYLGTLVPVIGLIQVGGHAMADRYSYITLTGLFIIIAWGLPDLLAKWRYKKIALTLSALLIILAMTICTHLQLRYWRNSLTLSQHALDVTRDNYMAHFCIAKPLLEQGRLDETIYHCSEAVRIKPDYVEALNGLGVALCKAGRIDEAVAYYEKALGINPRYVKTYLNFGVALTAKGKFDEAISLYNKALQITPDFVEVRLNLGAVLINTGRFTEAVEEYEEALRIQPQNALVHNDFGVVLCRQGRFDEAIEHFDQAIRINPNYTAAKNNLDRALAEKQKLQNTDAEGTKK